jgi:hypothetical protein
LLLSWSTLRLSQIGDDPGEYEQHDRGAMEPPSAVTCAMTAPTMTTASRTADWKAQRDIGKPSFQKAGEMPEPLAEPHLVE